MALSLKKLLAASLIVAGIGYAGHSCVNSDEGYRALQSNSRLADRVISEGSEFFEGGRRKLAEITHTTEIPPRTNYFEHNSYRTGEKIDDLSGYAQIAAGIGLGLAALLGLGYIVRKITN